MNIKRESGRNKRFSVFLKIVVIICITIAAIIIAGTVMHNNKTKARESAIAEMENEISNDYEICRNILNNIKADDFTVGMIDIYKGNIDNAENPAEKFSIGISMLRFTASELGIYETKLFNNTNKESTNAIGNYKIFDKQLNEEQSKLIKAKNKIYDI